MQRNRPGPLYPQKRTCAVQLGMSAKDHKRRFGSANDMSVFWRPGEHSCVQSTCALTNPCFLCEPFVFTYKSWSRKKYKINTMITEVSTMSMRSSTTRPALSGARGASPNHLSMKSIRLTRLSRQASCRTPERCATSHNRRGYGVGPWSNTVLHHRLQSSVLRKWNTTTGRCAFSLSPQKNRAELRRG
jgi:hypothetical protein